MKRRRLVVERQIEQLMYLTSREYFISALNAMAFSVLFAVAHAVTVQAR